MKIQANIWTESGYRKQKIEKKATSEQKIVDSPNSEVKPEESEVSDPLQEIDTVELTQDSKPESSDFKDELQKMRDEWSNFKNQLDNAIEQGEGAAKMWKIKILCLQIAMRIMRGDKVPVEDERYLAKHDIELFTKALSMRMPKEDPHEYDRLSEDEEEEKENSGASSDPPDSATPAPANATPIDTVPTDAVPAR